MRSLIERLKDRAWDTFSLWIRTRDGFKCVTCGSTTQQMNAGHFWHGVLDFDEENINCQCVHCNKWLSGNLAVYSVYLLQKIGKEKFDALNIRHSMAWKGEIRTEQDYRDIIERYRLTSPSSVDQHSPILE